MPWRLVKDDGTIRYLNAVYSEPLGLLQAYAGREVFVMETGIGSNSVIERIYVTKTRYGDMICYAETRLPRNPFVWDDPREEEEEEEAKG